MLWLGTEGSLVRYDMITQGHGGTLTIEIEKGEGVSFVITLPCETKA